MAHQFILFLAGLLTTPSLSEIIAYYPLNSTVGWIFIKGQPTLLTQSSTCPQSKPYCWEISSSVDAQLSIPIITASYSDVQFTFSASVDTLDKSDKCSIEYTLDRTNWQELVMYDKNTPQPFNETATYGDWIGTADHNHNGMYFRIFSTGKGQKCYFNEFLIEGTPSSPPQISCGQTVTGDISPFAVFDYLFVPAATQSFHSCNSTDQFDTYIEVFRADTQEIVVFDDDGSCPGGYTLFSNLTWSYSTSSFPSNPTFYVRVRGLNSNAIGSYALTMECSGTQYPTADPAALAVPSTAAPTAPTASPTTHSPTVSPTNGRIACGQTITGYISSGAAFDFNFDPAASQTFHTCGSPDDVDTYVEVYRSDTHERVAFDDDEACANTNYTFFSSVVWEYWSSSFPSNITFYVRVKGFSSTYTGNFALTMECSDIRYYTTISRSITCGQTISGDISAGSHFDYLFAPAASQTFDTCNSDLFDTYIEVFSADQQIVANNDDNGCSQNWLLSSVTWLYDPSSIAAASPFYVRVRGASTSSFGSYTLSMQCTDTQYPTVSPVTDAPSSALPTTSSPSALPTTAIPTATASPTATRSSTIPSDAPSASPTTPISDPPSETAFPSISPTAPQLIPSTAPTLNPTIHPQASTPNVAPTTASMSPTTATPTAEPTSFPSEPITDEGEAEDPDEPSSTVTASSPVASDSTSSGFVVPLIVGVVAIFVCVGIVCVYIARRAVRRAIVHAVDASIKLDSQSDEPTTQMSTFVSIVSPVTETKGGENPSGSRAEIHSTDEPGVSLQSGSDGGGQLRKELDVLTPRGDVDYAMEPDEFEVVDSDNDEFAEGDDMLTPKGNLVDNDELGIEAEGIGTGMGSVELAVCD